MEINDSFHPNSPLNPFLDKFTVNLTEDEDNETIIDSEFSDDQMDDDLNQIQTVIDGLEDIPLDQSDGKQSNANDSDVEIVANCSEDEFPMGSHLMAKKYLKNRQTNSESIDGHKECEKRRHTERRMRAQMEMELELERQQRIAFQRQLEEYMMSSLQKQFDDSKQIMSLKFELLKCRQHLQEMKKCVNCGDHGIDSVDETTHRLFKDKEFNCLDCCLPLVSEVSMILHLINHTIDDKKYCLETKVFKLYGLRIDWSLNSVKYCCPRCGQTFNCVDIYYHIYSHHTKERPIVCTECNVFFTHLDYSREHNQTKHNGVVDYITFIDIALISPELRPQPLLQTPKGTTSHMNGAISSKHTFKNIGTYVRNGNTVQKEAIDSWEEDDDDDSEPEVIQLSDSPTPRRPAFTIRPLNSSHIPIPKRTVTEDFKCDFADCEFKTTSKDKLDFHFSAHIKSKFKCPFCAYVGNILNDIYRHIQKSKKHDGFKVFECRFWDRPNFRCNYGTNCLNDFKDHLNAKHFDSDSDNDEEIEKHIKDMFRNEHCL